MSFESLSPLLAFAPTPSQPGTAPDPKAQMLQTVGLLVFFGLMLYFTMIRPQQKKARDHAKLMQGLKSGDKVVTSGGLVGVVVSLKDRTVTIRSADAKFEVLKSAVSEIIERASTSNES